MGFKLILLVLLTCVMVGLSGSVALAQEGAAPSQEPTVTIPKADWEALLSRLDALEQEVQALKAGPAAPTTSETPPVDSGSECAPVVESPAPIVEAPAGGKFLALPDISLIVQAKGLLSSDTREEFRNQLRLSELELGIQGWVYPNVKADAFIAMSPAEDEPAQVEEAYLSYIGLAKGLNCYVGEKHVAFDRVNLLHNHSWPYVRQPLALTNLVAPESLTGEGLAASYCLPVKGNLFAQLDLGTWTRSAPPEDLTWLPDVLVGPGAGFTNQFNTARLWTGTSVGECNELELGTSYAAGPAQSCFFEEPGRATLKGVDVSYRHFGEGESRLLLRGEGVWRHEESDLGGSTASGYYLFGNYRPNKYFSTGLLYDWSEFPQAPNLHESALSVIFTRQYSEQYYLRLQAVRGDRPDCGPYDALWLQWCWGVGPHTHNLE